MRFTGVHRIRPISGWLLSYGLKGVSAAMVARLARCLLSCYRGIMNLHKRLCHLGPDNPTDIKNDKQWRSGKIVLIYSEG
jgi:hypothetical protein